MQKDRPTQEMTIRVTTEDLAALKEAAAKRGFRRRDQCAQRIFRLGLALAVEGSRARGRKTFDDFIDGAFG